MFIKLNGLFLVLCLILTTALTVSCGGDGKAYDPNVLLGPYFAIEYPDGFNCNWTDMGAEIEGKSFTVIVKADKMEGAKFGQLQSVADTLSAIESGLEGVVKDNFEDGDAKGIIMTGTTDNKNGVALFVPLDEYLVTVYTDPRPNTKAELDSAMLVVESFRLTNPDYFNKTLEPDPENGGDEDGTDETGETTSQPSEDKADNPEKFENDYISMTIPADWELTSDDRSITILEPDMVADTNTLSFSIQYVDLGEEMKVDEFAGNMSEQLDSKIEMMTFGGNEYRVIQSDSDRYSEFHFITKRNGGLPLMVTVISRTESIPEDARTAIESIEIK